MAGLTAARVSAYAQNQFDTVVWHVGGTIEDTITRYAQTQDRRGKYPRPDAVAARYEQLMKIGEPVIGVAT